MGILLMAASNVNIVGVNVSKTWGDGVEVMYDSQWNVSTNVSLCGVVVDNARRNGLGITGAYGVQITDSTFENTGISTNGQAGTPPMAGCDVEPDGAPLPHGPNLAEEIWFQNCLFTGNVEQGLVFTGFASNTTVANNRVRDSMIRGNGSTGLGLYYASGSQVSGNNIAANGSYGILIDTASGNHVTGNTLDSNAPDAVVLVAPSNNNSITDNTCVGTYGTIVANALCSGCSGNTVNNNDACMIQ
jgi:parallel beta-helix repeat protein